MRNSDFHIAVLPGDGIGREVTSPCLDLLNRAAARVGGLGLRFETLPGGAGHYRETGRSMPSAAWETCRRADAILLAAMGLPDVRYPDGREIAPQLELRFELGDPLHHAFHGAAAVVLVHAISLMRLPDQGG